MKTFLNIIHIRIRCKLYGCGW